ncbi:hypothetical protein BC833DRAFT_565723 [Globomyces pollinis-pini]|nr:hypothetical protein BC833DRAFT_565723 [Globomyces pollinis-pini]
MTDKADSLKIFLFNWEANRSVMHPWYIVLTFISDTVSIDLLVTLIEVFLRLSIAKISKFKLHKNKLYGSLWSSSRCGGDPIQQLISKWWVGAEKSVMYMDEESIIHEYNEELCDQYTMSFSTFEGLGVYENLDCVNHSIIPSASCDKMSQVEGCIWKVSNYCCSLACESFRK